MKQRLTWSGGRQIAVTLLSFWAACNLLGQADPTNYATTDSTPATEQVVPDEDYLYFDLGCNMGPWSGYFAPQRWERIVKDSPVAALPATANHEAAGQSPSIIFAEDRKDAEQWMIEIPAAGYLSFCLQPSATGKRIPVSIMINDQPSDYQVRSDGLYYSPFLQQGDRFSVLIPAGVAVYHWSKLMFHSNFNAVIVRPNAPTPEQRFVVISEGNIQRVFFPSEAPGTWPVFDQDGDRTTTYDQTELRSSTERFEVDYTDNQVLNQDTFQLERTFIIREKCSRANWLKRSRIWCTLPIINTP